MSRVRKVLPKPPSGRQPHVSLTTPHEMATMRDLGSSHYIPLTFQLNIARARKHPSGTHTVAIPPNGRQQHVLVIAPHKVATMATTYAHHDTNGIQLRVAWVLEHLCGAHKDHTRKSPNHLVLADGMFWLLLLHIKCSGGPLAKNVGTTCDKI